MNLKGTFPSSYYNSLVSKSIDVYGIAANTTEEQAELVASVLEMMAHLGQQNLEIGHHRSPRQHGHVGKVLRGSFQGGSAEMGRPGRSLIHS